MKTEDSPKSEQSYRRNVSLVTWHDQRFLLVNLLVWPPDYWKFPQGGVNQDESYEHAALREFREELGTDKLRIVAKSGIMRQHNWTKSLIIDGQTYIGQEQKFLIVEYLGTGNDILVKSDEIRCFCWSKPQNLEKLINRTQLDFSDYWKTIQAVLNEQKLLLSRKGVFVHH